MELTQQRLKELVTYNPQTGLFIRNKNGKVIGNVHHTGYIRFMLDKKEYLAHRLAWLYMYGVIPKNQIDHKNNDRSDNRIDNLREVTHSENQQNRLINENNTSGVTGVYFSKRSNRWYAQISIDGKNIHLGQFGEYYEAVNARKNAEILYYGGNK